MAKAKIKIGDLLRSIDHATLRELAVHQLEAGHSRQEVIDDIVETIDALIPWSVIGPVGTVIEAIDGPIAKGIATLIVNAAIAGKGKRHG